MKAALLLAPRQIQLQDAAAPEAGPADVLIEPIQAGICGSDVSLYLGHRKAPAYPLLLGHEVVGRIVAAGEEVTKLRAGQRVIVEPNYPCGTCAFCRAGRGNICPNKRSLGVTISGCFAESFAAPAEYVWAIPDTVSDDDAVAIEPLAVSLHALWQSGAQLGDTVAVIGCGATGLLLIHAAVAAGMRVFAYDKLDGKMQMARELGAAVRPDAEVADLWREESVSTVFECAGASATVELALSAVPRGGQVVLLGLSSAQANFQPLRFVREGLRVSGSIIYDHPHDFARAISLVEQKVLVPSRIVSHRFAFDDTPRALEVASTGEAGKVLLSMPS